MLKCPHGLYAVAVIKPQVRAIVPYIRVKEQAERSANVQVRMGRRGWVGLEGQYTYKS
jgi:hypothetical protein